HTCTSQETSRPVSVQFFRRTSSRVSYGSTSSSTGFTFSMNEYFIVTTYLGCLPSSRRLFPGRRKLTLQSLRKLGEEFIRSSPDRRRAQCCQLAGHFHARVHAQDGFGRRSLIQLCTECPGEAILPI